MLFSCVFFFFFFNILCYHMRWGKCAKQWRAGREAAKEASKPPVLGMLAWVWVISTPTGEPLRPYL